MFVHPTNGRTDVRFGRGAWQGMSGYCEDLASSTDMIEAHARQGVPLSRRNMQ
ncbi:hypothetical protein TspCOW1_01010 [Thiohalobacter sp. COW1]|nr:hypothetical protein TspCOW1_01010 [Thiohalobacter sp. COW1]